MQLPFGVRWKLVRQDLLALIGAGGHQRVRVIERDGRCYIETREKSFCVPSPLRWKLYRKGWASRLDQLADEYGVGRHFNLGADDVVLDIGANAGEFAFVCARVGASVHCLEPDPGVFTCLSENVAALDTAFAHQELIWKDDAPVRFALAPARADSSVFAEGAETELQAVTLDTFCEANGIKDIALIKCDAEGAEPEVLEGAANTLCRTRCVALDTGPERNGARTHAACAALLSRAGFRVIEERIGKRCMTYGVRQ